MVPILKGGTVKEVSNYKLISLLPLVSKVLERCVYNRVIDHIAPQLHKLQFGFLKGKSTTAHGHYMVTTSPSRHRRKA